MESEEIERKSLEIIENRLKNIKFPEKEIVKRIVHATADFSFVNRVLFKKKAIEAGIKVIKRNDKIVTDVNMVKAGVKYDNVKCYVDLEEVRAYSERVQTTRAAAAFRLFKEDLSDSIVVVGSAPTALFELCALLEEGIFPDLVIACPVGLIGAKESKEKILNYNVPSIVVKGKRGGSNIAVGITNALIKLAGKW
jgi:precorrin-8X/cobalt-precorrin-8 methylmutase